MLANSVLFGAGRGTRMRPLTDLVPKPVLPVLDAPLAAWALGAVTHAAPPVIVNASHLAEMLVESLAHLGVPDWRPFVEAPDAYGTAGTLRALRDQVGDKVVTCNGDVVADVRIDDLLDAHSDAGCLGTLAVRRVESRADLEISAGRVTGFVDRRRADVPGAQFLGIAVFERAALEHLPDKRPAGLGETLLRTLADRGALAAYELNGYWRDVGTPAAYLEVSLDVLHGRAPRPPIPLEGRVLEAGDGVAYLGPGARVEEGSLGPGAIVLRDAVVERGARVQDAVVFPRSRVPKDTQVEGGIWFQDHIVLVAPSQEG